MSNISYFNNIAINNNKQGIFSTLILVYGVYVSNSLNWVYAEVISIIQCYLPQGKKVSGKNKSQGILPTRIYIFGKSI